MVEKPMTSASEQALRLIDEAAAAQSRAHGGSRICVHRCRSQDQRDCRLRKTGETSSITIQPGSISASFQRDVDVIWDLAVHDLAIMDYILPSTPCAVAATGINHIFGGTENLAYITMFFEENVIAHVNVNWLSPVKVRRTLVGGSKQMIVYDDMEPSEKVKGLRQRNYGELNPDSLYKALVGYRSGDMFAPQLDVSEALKVEIQHFADCVKTGAEPITGGQAGLARSPNS